MRSRKTINLIIKISVVFLSLYFLYAKLRGNPDIQHFDKDYLFNLIYDNQLGLILVSFMMFLNWLVEAIKWRMLIDKIEKISILRALRAVFSGVTVSTFTPNRIGEYAGRVFCLKKANRIQAALITVLGSMSQLLTTIVFGSIAFLFSFQYLDQYNDSLFILHNNFILISIVLMVISVASLFLYFNIVNIIAKIKTISWISNIYSYIKVLSYYNKKELFQVFLYSILRYIIFTTQFFILLNLFEVYILYHHAIVLIMLMLLIISIIPTIAITEISLRGSIAVFLFSVFSQNILGILAATLFIWLINLVIPAFIGTIFIFTLKFFRKY